VELGSDVFYKRPGSKYLGYQATGVGHVFFVFSFYDRLGSKTKQKL